MFTPVIIAVEVMTMGKGNPIAATRLPRELYQQLKQLADARSVPISDLIREVLAAFLRENGSKRA